MTAPTVERGLLATYHPPVTTSSANWRREDGYTGIPLAEGPALFRTRKGRAEPRWHRVRCATRYEHSGGHTGVTGWCGTMNSVGGQRSGGGGAIFALALPNDGIPLCGKCEGAAVGAGYPPLMTVLTDPRGLLFSPRGTEPPPLCPSTRNGGLVEWEPPPHADRGWCHACGEPVRSWGSSVRRHEPGPGLVPACPAHRWDGMVLTRPTDDPSATWRPVCRCEVVQHAHIDPPSPTWPLGHYWNTYSHNGIEVTVR